jgi:hypothetical protein
MLWDPLYLVVVGGIGELQLDVVRIGEEDTMSEWEYFEDGVIYG